MKRTHNRENLVLAMAVVLATTGACDQRPERQADMAMRAAGETYAAGYEMLGDAIKQLERDIGRSGCRERRAHDGQSPYGRNAPAGLNDTYRFAWNNCDAALSGLHTLQSMAEQGGSGLHPGEVQERLENLGIHIRSGRVERLANRLDQPGTAQELQAILQGAEEDDSFWPDAKDATRLFEQARSSIHTVIDWWRTNVGTPTNEEDTTAR